MAHVTPYVTILTEPVPMGRWALPSLARRVGKACRDTLRPSPVYRDRRYGGHTAVTRSVVEGFRKIGVPATYNPIHPAAIAETVLVLSGVEALRQAIHWKRQGRITRLAAGPNIVNLPSDYDGVICAPEVDLVVTPSQPVVDIYVADRPDLSGRCSPWPAGVDAAFWRPAASDPDRRRLVWYHKPANWSGGDVSSYRAIAEASGYTLQDITYGAYRPEEYRAALQQSGALVGFVDSESQGVAWAESWACDVPTLIAYKDQTVFRNVPRLAGRAVRTSAAPYLSQATGQFFSGGEEFRSVIQNLDALRSRVRPRAWVLDHMTDEVIARRAVALFSAMVG